jgi:putative addiction module component (TIGR02574 family)
MNGNARHLLDEALQLSVEARAELARELIASLDGPADADVDEAWAKEVATRADDVRAGRVSTVPWSEAEARILNRLRLVRPR